MVVLSIYKETPFQPLPTRRRGSSRRLVSPSIENEVASGRVSPSTSWGGVGEGTYSTRKVGEGLYPSESEELIA
ncbi:hypothetical protein EV561_104288 [Rhizobium sp. BK376]|jgi:hypothetical protein|nr:hypothetical protein EV561_104288 [Rhizobium sp. BK376]